MAYSVIVNLGNFDIPMSEFNTRDGANAFFEKLKKLTDRAEIKLSSEVRDLHTTFRKDDICTDININ